jgi:hypothetical protein
LRGKGRKEKKKGKKGRVWLKLKLVIGGCCVIWG